ncbi:MAG: CoA pyrophosphatase [Deltaproteobacteria bacterium]|nr:CoA pyrophosphatase [Deltaproteobacteria bacterium]
MHTDSLEYLLTEEHELKRHIQTVLTGRTRRIIPKENLRESAVLVPVCFSENDPSIIVTKRSMNVEHHKGEISFPGGGSEPEDDGLIATALREAYEEIGLLPADVDVLGFLDDHISIMGFHITPVVGSIPCPYNFTINSESETLLHVPLRHALTDTAWMAEKTTFMGRDINIYFLEIEGGVVWGATARMLKHFIDLIAGRTVAFSKVSAHARSWVEDVMSKQEVYQVNNEAE